MAEDKELLEAAFELTGGALGTNPVCNVDKPIVYVKHSELTRADDGVFKSECPVCNRGLLLVQRGPDFKLSRYDRCVSCGQSFCYTDESIAGQALEPIEFVEKGRNPLTESFSALFMDRPSGKEGS